MKLTSSIDIHAPIEKVFQSLSEDEQMEKWMEGVVGIEYINQQTAEKREGTKFRLKIREGGKVTEYAGEITQYDKPRLLGIKLEHKMFAMNTYYWLETIENGVRVHCECHVAAFNWFSKWMGYLFRRLTRRILIKQLSMLKSLAESSI